VCVILQRGVYRQSNDPDGQHLVVKTSGRNRHRHHNAAAATAAAAAAPADQHNSKAHCLSGSNAQQPICPAAAAQQNSNLKAAAAGRSPGIRQLAVEPCVQPEGCEGDAASDDAAADVYERLGEQQGPQGLQSKGGALAAAVKDVVSNAGAAAVGDVPSAMLGSKNRQRALDRLQQAAAAAPSSSHNSSSSSSSAAGSYGGSQPSTPKVVLNRKAAVPAPWLQ
jgi:hypothetical protein